MATHRLCLLLVTGGLLGGCSRHANQVVEPVPSTVGAAGQRGQTPLLVITRHEDFFGNAARYLGNEVITTAPVADVLGDHALALKHGGFIGIAVKNILVINESGQAWDRLTKGEMVSVRGVARNFQRPVVEQRLGIQLDAATFERFEGEPYIAADALEIHGR